MSNSPIGNTFKGARILRILAVILTATLIFLVGLYGAGALFVENGGFTISFDKNTSINGETETGTASISLSETADFENASVRLNAQGINNMTNITETDIPDSVTSLDGVNNGAHYIAYTFYARNTGNAPCVLRETFNLESSVKGADEALRIKVYRNSTPTTYAKVASDGMPEFGTTAFKSDLEAYSVTHDLSANQTIKYTLVIWLEGNDPECLDNIKGGNAKMSLTFSIDPATS